MLMSSGVLDLCLWCFIFLGCVFSFADEWSYMKSENEL